MFSFLFVVDIWWRNYGTKAPNLRKFAMKILSQTCSSSGCERNWSVFEKIYSKKRNILELRTLINHVHTSAVRERCGYVASIRIPRMPANTYY